jgi:hypothetical protein
MTDNYTKRLDKEIDLWITRINSLKTDSDFFKNATKDTVKMFKTHLRKTYTLEQMENRLLGLLSAKMIYHQSLKDDKTNDSRY